MEAHMRFDWPYLTLRADGTLVYADTRQPIRDCGRDLPRFESHLAAAAYLVENNIRGTVE
jgi:hypothetical protein